MQNFAPQKCFAYNRRVLYCNKKFERTVRNSKFLGGGLAHPEDWNRRLILTHVYIVGLRLSLGGTTAFAIIISFRTMCNGSTAGQRQRPSPVAPLTTAARDESKPSWIPVLILSVFLSIDVVVSLVLFTPLIPRLNAIEDESPRYTLWGSLWDLGILTALRSFAVIYALVRCYHQDGMESPFNSHHPNGDKKSREELEEEALEESCLPWFRRYISRYSFPCELISVITASFVVVKCLSRLNVEIGIFDDAKPNNPLFWFALCIAAMAAVVECGFVDSVGERAGKCGQYRRRQNGFIRRNISVASRIGSFLNIPLLSAEANVDSEENDIEALGEETNENSELDVDIRASSDIAGDAEYKAGWTDLIGMCKGDSHLIALAFVFLVAAAAAQIYIPKYTGNILDALSEAYNGKDSDQSSTDVLEIPGFMSNIIKLVIVSILGGIFSGIRGSIFTVVGGRVNVRLRVLLMDSLLSQDIGFFDVTKTGDITSRLSSDTTLVGDQVSLNVNVFLRSLVQSIGVLIFMFMISWKLSLLAFISGKFFSFTFLFPSYASYHTRTFYLSKQYLSFIGTSARDNNSQQMVWKLCPIADKTDAEEAC